MGVLWKLVVCCQVGLSSLLPWEELIYFRLVQILTRERGHVGVSALSLATGSCLSALRTVFPLSLAHYHSQNLSGLTSEVLSSSSQQLVENVKGALFLRLANSSGFFQQVWWGNCWGKRFTGGKSLMFNLGSIQRHLCHHGSRRSILSIRCISWLCLVFTLDGAASLRRGKPTNVTPPHQQ